MELPEEITELIRQWRIDGQNLKHAYELAEQTPYFKWLTDSSDATHFHYPALEEAFRGILGGVFLSASNGEIPFEIAMGISYAIVYSIGYQHGLVGYQLTPCTQADHIKVEE